MVNPYDEPYSDKQQPAPQSNAAAEPGEVVDHDLPHVSEQPAEPQADSANSVAAQNHIPPDHYEYGVSAEQSVATEQGLPPAHASEEPVPLEHQVPPPHSQEYGVAAEYGEEHTVPTEHDFLEHALAQLALSAEHSGPAQDDSSAGHPSAQDGGNRRRDVADESGSVEETNVAERSAPVATVSGVDDEDSDSVEPDQRNEPLFFPVSIKKLVIMSFVSIGFYQVWWMFKNWLYIQKDSGRKMKPGWRSFFFVLWLYPLVKQIVAKGKQFGAHPSFSPLAIFVAYLVLYLTTYVPKPFNLLFLFTIIPIVAVQQYINEINVANNPKCIINSQFTLGNWLWIIFGGLFTIAAVIGSFMPD